MSSNPSTTPPSSNSNNSHWAPVFDELRWVIQMRHTLDEELEEDDGIEVTIFNVPKPLRQSKPESFIPQLIALGPYHHWRPELYEMERYKLSSAKRVQKKLPDIKFQQLVDRIAKHEHRIRAHYHRYLDFNGETLAWMMAVDTCFLLEFLQVYEALAMEEGRVMRRVSLRMSHLVDTAGRKSAHNIILRDIMMLENQIPLFLLRKILDLQHPSSEGDEVLTRMLTGFMKELSPFKMVENFPNIDVSQHTHLLELLYYVIVPKSEEQGENNEIEEQADEAEGSSGLRGDPSHVKQLCNYIWGMASNLNGAPVQYVKNALLSRPVKFIVKVPRKIITTLPGFSMLKQPVEYLFSSAGQDKAKPDDPSAGQFNKPPLIEEIMIPSVEELTDSRVRFCPTNGDITTTAFDLKTVTFYLPTVSLDVNTEVVLRNLVAYEASVATRPLVFTRYTELMNGIIDTEEDVKLLRYSGVILNHMKSDGEVANLWNGMSKSVRLTRVPFLDKVIEDVNKYHSSRWRVKTRKFMKKYVFGSWPFLTYLAAILLLLLTGLQAFCSVYSCARWFHVPSVGQQN